MDFWPLRLLMIGQSFALHVLLSFYVAEQIAVGHVRDAVRGVLVMMLSGALTAGFLYFLRAVDWLFGRRSLPLHFGQ